MDPLDKAATIMVDISQSIDTKIKALLQHKSQVGNPNDVAQSVRNVASALGAASGMQYSEWFSRVLML